ncbi:MAG: 8-amino-7-oxononanoate synthase [Burkholderiales bacterium]
MSLTQLRDQLQRLETQGLLRRRRILQSQQGTHVRVDGHELVSFCSNDYLGLASHPELIEAAREGAKLYGVGAGASHLMSGHFDVHHLVEEKLAQFTGLPQALLFSTGYMANIGVVMSLLGRDDALYADKLNHASLNDAALLSRAGLHRYPHLDVQALGKQLAASSAKRKLVMTDAVFSMDGDIAPLPDLLDLCEHFDAWLLIDDAHGFGVLGKEGRGALWHFNMRSPRIIYMGTLGKAAGVCGAFVAAEKEVVATLIQRSRSYIYTTASPPLLAHVLLKSLDLIQAEHGRRTRLASLVALLRQSLRLKSWRLLESQTPIQPLIIGDAKAAMSASQALAETGFLVPAIRPPTVPQGTARLRISVSADHTIEDIGQLANALNELDGKIDTRNSENAEII